MYTFGKAMGIHGACVVGSKHLIEYLINFGRSFVYTTASPPHHVAAIDCAFDYLQKNIHLQETLNQKISLFSKLTKDLTNKIESTSAIHAIIIEGNTRIRNISSDLQREGFDVRPILSPTVQPGSERLRLCLHTYNTDEEIKQLVNSMKSIKHRHQQ